MKQANPSIWSMHAHPNGQAVSSFKVTKKLAPGTPGAQKLLHRFGDALVCVRHRVTPDGEASAPLSSSCWSKCLSVRAPAGRWAFKSASVKRHSNRMSRRRAGSGTLCSAFGSCRCVRPDNWSCPTVYVLWRNEIDVDSIFIQKRCIYPKMDGCGFELRRINQSLESQECTTPNDER